MKQWLQNCNHPDTMYTVIMFTVNSDLYCKLGNWVPHTSLANTFGWFYHINIHSPTPSPVCDKWLDAAFLPPNAFSGPAFVSQIYYMLLRHRSCIWIWLYLSACVAPAHLSMSLTTDLLVVASYTSWVPGPCFSIGRPPRGNWAVWIL